MQKYAPFMGEESPGVGFSGFILQGSAIQALKGHYSLVQEGLATASADSGPWHHPAMLLLQGHTMQVLWSQGGFKEKHKSPGSVPGRGQYMTL